MDKNVYITPTGDKGSTYYFPACHIWIHLDKHLSELPIPKGSMALDLLLSARTMRLTGNWRDDYGKDEFDGLHAWARLVQFVKENEDEAIIYQFHWGIGTLEEPNLYVKVISIDSDREGGYKGVMPYNIVFRRITEGG